MRTSRRGAAAAAARHTVGRVHPYWWVNLTYRTLAKWRANTCNHNRRRREQEGNESQGRARNVSSTCASPPQRGSWATTPPTTDRSEQHAQQHPSAADERSRCWTDLALCKLGRKRLGIRLALARS